MLRGRQGRILGRILVEEFEADVVVALGKGLLDGLGKLAGEVFLDVPGVDQSILDELILLAHLHRHQRDCDD